ncbi:hypothetical protein Tco_0787700 [Tanacetum coccineum]
MRQCRWIKLFIDYDCEIRYHHKANIVANALLAQNEASEVVNAPAEMLRGLDEQIEQTTEKISQIKDRLKAARDHQKSYADKRMKHLEFSVGDHVLLKVSPWKGVVCFGKKGKLAPRFVGPFEITERIGLEIQVDAKLNFVEEPVEILEKEFKKLKRSRIPIVKVRLNSKRGPEFTWEGEDQMKLKYPHLFSASYS